MRWLVRLRGGGDEVHVADLAETGGAPAPRHGSTACGLSGELMPDRPVGHMQRDELRAAAMGACPRCLSMG